MSNKHLLGKKAIFIQVPYPHRILFILFILLIEYIVYIPVQGLPVT